MDRARLRCLTESLPISGLRRRAPLGWGREIDRAINLGAINAMTSPFGP